MIVENILSIEGNLEDVDTVIMRSHSEILVVWRILHALNPFLWCPKFADKLVEIIVVEDLDISLIV